MRSDSKDNIVSPRWSGRLLLNLGLRLASLVLLILGLATGRVSGVAFGFVLAAAIAIFVMLVFRVTIHVKALSRSRARLVRTDERGEVT